MAKAACWAAFNTTELLERIVSYLPPPIILKRASLVSKLWNNAIRTSPTVQEMLWQNPQATEVWSPNGLTELDNILWLQGNIASDRFAALSSGLPMYSGAYQLNPFLPDSPSQRYRHSVPGVPTLPVKCQFLLRDWMLGTRRTGGYYIQMSMTRNQPSEARSETPTWLDMHLTEPPISTVWIEVFAEVDWTRTTHGRLSAPVPEPVQATVRDRGGVTFGLVRDMADRMAAHPAYERFAREQNPITIRICFFVDRESSKPG